MTVFLALLLAVFLGVNGVLLDYGRAQMLSYQTEAAVTAAVESVFAGYSAPLWSEYELFGRMVPEDDVDQLTEQTLDYAAEWGHSSRGTFTALGSYEGEWDRLVFLTDENGAVFREMATKAIQSETGEILLGEWKKRLGLSDSETAGKLAESAKKDSVKPGEVFEKYEDMQESLTEAETAAAEAERAAREAAAAAEAAAGAAGAAGGTAEGAGDGSGGSDGRAGNDLGGPDSHAGNDLAGSENSGAVSADPDAPVDTRTSAEKEKGKKYLDLIDTIRRLLTQGILVLAVPEGFEISGASIPSGVTPSSLSSAEKGRSVRSVGGSGNDLLFREYLMRHMTCFTTDTEKSPRYELEYLIAGKSSDEANLKSAVTRLLWMRLGMNLMYLEKSPEKKAAAMEAAGLAAAWTGQPELVELVGQLILIAWASAEGLWDVRHLLSGGRIPMMKTDESWHLSLENAAENWRETVANEKEEGLSYADYLRVCLYLAQTGTLSYRAMDAVQWNIRRLDRGFLLSACIVEGRFTMRTSGRLLFRPLYRSMVSGGDPALLCEKQAARSYLPG